MPTPTHELIASQVIDTVVSTITFNSISQSYKDLVVVFDGVTTGTSIFGKLNNDSTASYNAVTMSTLSTTPDSRNISGSSIFIVSRANTTSKTSIVLQIQNYSSATMLKSMLIKTTTGQVEIDNIHALWSNTSAVTRVDLQCSNFAVGNTVYLYGIVG